MISVLTAFVLFGLLGSFRNAVATYGNVYANVLVVQSRNVRLPYSHVTRLSSVPGVAATCGVLIAPARLPSGKRTLVQGVDDRALFEVHPGISASPQARAAWHAERSAVLVSAEMAKDNGRHVGDRLLLPGPPKGLAYRRADGTNALEVVIAGEFSAQNGVAAQGMFAHYDYLRDLIGAERAGMEYIAVRLAPGEDVDIQRNRIDAQFANSAAPVKTYSFRALLRAYYGTYRELARLSVVVLAISSITLLLIAGSVLAQAQRERARETAVLEAIGWSKARVAAFLGLECALLLLPPAMIGLGMARLLARKIDSGISLVEGDTQATIEALLLALFFVLAISVIPVARSVAAQIAPRLVRE